MFKNKIIDYGQTLAQYAEPKPDPTFGKLLTMGLILIFVFCGISNYIESINIKTEIKPAVIVQSEPKEIKPKLTPELVKTMSKEEQATNLKILIENAEIEAINQAIK